MKAIRTKYLPATDKLPARIVATADGMEKMAQNWNHDLDTDANHAALAHTFASKYGWLDRFVLRGGGLGDSFYWVLIPIEQIQVSK
jgi:hypothetical protein